MRYQGFLKEQGYIDVNKKLKFDEMSEQLRIDLWNEVARLFLNQYLHYIDSRENRYIVDIVKDLWTDCLGKRLDQFTNAFLNITVGWGYAIDVIPETLSKYFFEMNCKQVYDFIHYLLQLEYREIDEFSERCNNALIENGASWRIEYKKIIPIVDENEKIAIGEARDSTEEKFPGVFGHLDKALDFLATMESDNFGQCIDHSASAVESICRHIADTDKQLSDALNIIKNKNIIYLHPVMIKLIRNIFDYASDIIDGRHSDKATGKTEVDNKERIASYEDAKFIFVSSSAVVTYLVQKFKNNDESDEAENNDKDVPW